MLKTYFVGLSFLLIVADVRCEPHYTFNFEAGGWLKLHTTPETWEEAFVRCLNDGAVLASPLNKELATALHSQMAQSGVNGHIFLGTHDLFFKTHFTSIEGVPLSDMEIRWGSPGDGADTGDCLTMSVDGRVYYSSCKEPLPFICYMKLENQTMNECGTFDDDYHLNQQTGSCYKIHPEKLIWTDAYGMCASEGAYLVILNDEQEASIVKGMFPVLTKDTDPFEKIHTGLRAWGKGRIWATIQGERIKDVYNNWYPGQPDNFEGNQDRGAYLRDGYLDDIESDVTRAMFVCEKSPKSKRFEAFPPCTETLMRLCNVCDQSQSTAN